MDLVEFLLLSRLLRNRSRGTRGQAVPPVNRRTDRQLAKIDRKYRDRIAVLMRTPGSAPDPIREFNKELALTVYGFGPAASFVLDGQITVDLQGALMLPQLPHEPGIRRLDLTLPAVPNTTYYNARFENLEDLSATPSDSACSLWMQLPGDEHSVADELVEQLPSEGKTAAELQVLDYAQQLAWLIKNGWVATLWHLNASESTLCDQTGKTYREDELTPLVQTAEGRSQVIGMMRSFATRTSNPDSPLAGIFKSRPAHWVDTTE